jgi:transposase-like protein
MALFGRTSTAEEGAEMSNVLRSVAKRKKKSRRLGEVRIMSREEYEAMNLDTKVEMIRTLVPLGLMHAYELMKAEVEALVGARYSRKAGSAPAMRHGRNPGSIRMAGQRVPIRVPRVRGPRAEVPLRSYAALQGPGEVNDILLRRVLYGLSCRNYEAAAEAIPGAIGLSSSSVSRSFVAASAVKLKEFQERDLSQEDIVAIFLDGKTFAEATMVVALGVTLTGEKRFLGFVETDTENEKVLTPFLRSLIERGMDISDGVLVIIDGGKGLRAAVNKAFRSRALVQRCMWHYVERRIMWMSPSPVTAGPAHDLLAG